MNYCTHRVVSFFIIVACLAGAHMALVAHAAEANLTDRAARRAALRERWQSQRGSAAQNWERGTNERDRQQPSNNRRRATYQMPWALPPIQTGYLFIDGTYLPPPYILRVVGEQLLVNNQGVALPQPNELAAAQTFDSLAMYWSQRLTSQLQYGNVVIASGDVNGMPSISLLPRFEEGYEFLTHLDGASGSLGSTERPYLRQFQGYIPSRELADRLDEDLPHLRSARELAQVASPQAQSLGSWAYPLTACAMLLVAVASGQLVVSRSLLVKDASEKASEISQSTQRCLLFIIGLSLLDLICTLLAQQAGVMHELNPLAGQFLGSPLALTAFKVGITLGGAALLYALRSHFPARRAAWWLCLVCVLVTVRWVAFNSLFVG